MDLSSGVFEKLEGSDAPEDYSSLAEKVRLILDGKTLDEKAIVESVLPFTDKNVIKELKKLYGLDKS